MFSSCIITAVAAVLFTTTSNAEPVPARVAPAVPAVVVRAPIATNSPVLLGCYQSSKSFIQVDNAWNQFQTPGSCQGLCVPLTHPVLAINFQTCSCADSIDVSAKVDSKFCTTPCPGYGTLNCGGNSTSGTVYYSLWNAGYENTELIPSASMSSGGAVASSTSSSSPSVVTIGGQTIVVTQSSTPGSNSGSSGPNTAGIAAGVVVGIVLIAAIGLGVWLYIRSKRRREVEEEHKREVSASTLTGTSTKPGSSGGYSVADTRLDQSIMTSRRMSDGSIADNQDYSRRILKVTNA